MTAIHPVWIPHQPAARLQPNQKSGDCNDREAVNHGTYHPMWGYTRLRGALLNVGIQGERSTIARIQPTNEKASFEK